MSISSSALLSALAGFSPIPDKKIHSILSHVMLLKLSAFNSQTTRIIVCLKKEHEKVWDITKEVLLNRIGAERFQKIAPKLNGFQAAYGTILLLSPFASYAEHFKAWSEHTSGMHQLMAWVALEAEGFGANLQHYNAIIDEKVAAAFNVPDTWKLCSQLVFGVPEGDAPAPKEKKPLKELMRFEGAEI
ncbi:Nitroreductase [Penicillium argentinense]|uniref:Nitroreductase n=1 Tax=Penicillium argentinense TaxID=1131581 RepID=A0A9W9K0Z0_9EURO|nr:Nitroreductase [Penicillium argentinense]KAJ5089068.1 Nitroreductase [Penicillium argentinense]